MAAVPVRVHEIERLLGNTRLNEKLIQQVCNLLRSTLTPMSDVRSSAEFRMDMAVEMLDRALREFSGQVLPRVDDL
jgi:xanthine dehydrogenase small subunit